MTPNQFIPLTQARTKLLRQWILFSVVIVFLMIFLSIFRGEYSELAPKMWGWIIPLLVPNFSLMISTFGAEALDDLESASSPSQVRNSYFSLSSGLSKLYLFLILISLLIEAFGSADFEPLGVLELSNIWLAVFEGFVTSSIGILFFTKKDRS